MQCRELNGVSFTKGCYVGQENTARMNWRQKVNRRLVVVPIADADEKRQVIAYPELGWSVEHRRVETIDADAAPLGCARGSLSVHDRCSLCC
jgi:folate-binding Fe-S cluster repair protein YgfZ